MIMAQYRPFPAFLNKQDHQPITRLYLPGHLKNAHSL